MRKVIIISLIIMGCLNVWQYMSSTFEQRSAYGAPIMAGNPIAENPSAARAIPSPSPKISLEPSAAPLPDPVVDASSRLKAAGLSSTFAALYLQAEGATGTPWELIAAVHYVETRQAGDTSVSSYAGAVGPMQFLPATYKAYAMDGDGDGVKVITDVDDAVYSGGRYLAANGAARGSYGQALYRYNHSNSYVTHTLALARKLGL